VNVIEQVMAPSLADKEIWIIDDDIPIHRAEFEHRDMLEGIRPIDRGTLRALLAVQWDDPAVKLVCDQLLKEARNVTAFVQPGHAIEYLDSGAPIPDAIIYDMKYQTLSKDLALEYLERLLRGCVATVQVYTKEPTEEALRELEPSMKKFPNRLVNPENKVLTNAKKIAQIIDDQLKTSLSASLSKRIRSLSLFAVETVLVKLDALPLAKAFELLAKDTTTAEELKLELVQLLSEKIGEYLNTSADLTDAFNKYAKARGVPETAISQAVQEMVSILAAQVRERILYDKALHEAVFAARQAITQNDGAGQQDENLLSIIREFFAFRLYSNPGDKIVRTGDVVAFGEENGGLPELFLIITPPCDLDKFLKKTRGTLTLARIYPLNEVGLQKSRSYGNKGFAPGDSITAKHPMVLPSIPISSTERLDYVLFAHEVMTVTIERQDLINAGSKNTQVQQPLMYNDLGNKWVRKCRVSEPFLSGILSGLSSQLFRSGIPDFPIEEQERLGGVFNAQQ
jgi:hypothetical protein